MAAALTASFVVALSGQQGVTTIRQKQGVTTIHQNRPEGGSKGAAFDWPLHSLDLSNSRYGAIDTINASNASQLKLAWSFEAGTQINSGQMTPLVVDGVMFFNIGATLMALDAGTGAPIWTFQGNLSAFTEYPDKYFAGRGRGPAYGEGHIYAIGESVLYAVNAKTGKLLESFGDGGLLPVVNRALQFKYPKKYRSDVDSLAMGYLLTGPPTYHGGTLYVPVANGDNHITGGLMIALDARTGAIKWVFSTIPQGSEEEGWGIAKDTWRGGARVGGGIWTQPAIDPDLGLIYFNAANPSPAYDGSARKGMNLFTNSTIALHLATGKLAWHFQTIHHDIWDLDFVNGPLLFDVPVDGRVVKGIAAAGKTCYLYVWNRKTGEPINPVIETLVPIVTDLPGEEVWPTQPIPYTSTGVPQQPFCATLPTVKDPKLAKHVRPMFTPLSSKEFLIISPGAAGGAGYGAPSYSAKTGLIYVSGKNTAGSSRIQLIGDSGRTGPGFHPFYDSRGKEGPTGMKQTGTLTAMNPVTGLQAWQQVLPTMLNGGNLVTSGDVVFQSTSDGHFYGFDARTGKEFFKFDGSNGIRADPITYQVGGKQSVVVVASHRILAFGLP
jgi:glucose dehydrogenase